MSEAASQLQSPPRATLSCHKCGSARLHRSRTRGVRERVLKFLNGMRAWRCDECGTRQLSHLKPRRRRSLPQTPAVDFRPNPGPDPKPAPSPEPKPDPLPMPDPKPRRSRRKDPLAQKIKVRRTRRKVVTAILVLAAGLGGAVLVMRASKPVTQDVVVVD